MDYNGKGVRSVVSVSDCAARSEGNVSFFKEVSTLKVENEPVSADLV